MAEIRYIVTVFLMAEIIRLAAFWCLGDLGSCSQRLNGVLFSLSNNSYSRKIRINNYKKFTGQIKRLSINIKPTIRVSFTLSLCFIDHVIHTKTNALLYVAINNGPEISYKVTSLIQRTVYQIKWVHANIPFNINKDIEC